MLEAHRVHQRTRFDVEMMKETGYCHGIENYSRHLSGRLPGEPPPTLLDYLPADAMIFIDESHQTVPQLRGMYHGDRSRKEVLVSHGFRLPSALDNRPLTFEEFEHRVNQLVYVSATPGPYELTKVAGSPGDRKLLVVTGNRVLKTLGDSVPGLPSAISVTPDSGPNENR